MTEQPQQPAEPYPYPMEPVRAATPAGAEPPVQQPAPPAVAGSPESTEEAAETAPASSEQPPNPTPPAGPAREPDAGDSQDAPGSEIAEPVRADEPVIITPVEQEPAYGPANPATAEPPARQDGPASDAPPAEDPPGYAPPPDAQPIDSGNAEVVTDETLPKTMAEATMGDNPDAPVSSVHVHEGVLVRLKDVFAHIENWAARHPELARFIAADLKSSISTAERVNDQGGAAPAGDTTAQANENAEAEFLGR